MTDASVVDTVDSGVGTQGTEHGTRPPDRAAASVDAPARATSSSGSDAARTEHPIQNKNARGAAYIYEQSDFGSLVSVDIARAYKKWFRDTGLNTYCEISSEGNQKPVYKLNATDQVSIFLIWESDERNTLKEALQQIKIRVPPSSPKLLLFCREVESLKPLSDMVKAEIQLATTLLPGFEGANVFFLYMAADEANLKSFLDELKTQYEESGEDKTYRGGYPCISSIAPSKLEISKKYPTFRCLNGLAAGQKLRIEARSFDNCLLRNSTKLVGQKTWDEFDPFETGKVRIEKEDESYENSRDGHVLIISNEKFICADQRRGTRIDLQNLEDLFSKLKYPNVVVHTNLTAERMKTAVHDFSQERFSAVSETTRSVAHGSFAILVILSHGSDNQVFGVDELPVDVKDLIRPIANCNSLAGKPKLVIINACRGSSFEEAGLALRGEYAYSGTTQVSQTALAIQSAEHYLDVKELQETADNSPNTAGLIVAFATTPGNQSYAFGFSGSRFINALCQTVYHRAGEHHVADMIGKVNYVMTRLCESEQPKQEGGSSKKVFRQKQISSWIVETTKNFYLVKTKVLKPEKVSLEPEE